MESGQLRMGGCESLQMCRWHQNKGQQPTKKALSHSINKPGQEFWALNVMFNETFKDGMNSPYKVLSASNHLHSALSFILVFTYWIKKTTDA